MSESHLTRHATPVVIPPGGAHRPGRHRLPAPPSALRGRAAVLAVAAGAAVSAASAGSAMTTGGTHTTEAGDIALLANGEQVPAEAPTSAPSSSATPSTPAPVVLASTADDSGAENPQSVMLYAGTENNAQREIEEEIARRPRVVLPAVGEFTSPFAMRWGSFHGGIDIANALGTPILAATDGVVVNAGPAQGYGNWVRIMSDDGVLTTYGHMQTVDVTVGQRVVAGQKIAGMGSLGFSTGSHLHFEVEIGGQKVDPVPWLAQYGLRVPGTYSEDGSGSFGS